MPDRFCTGQPSLEQIHERQDAAGFSAGERSQWFLHEGTGAPRAVAVVVHGFNARPSVMNDIVGLLATHGVDVLRMSLSGHGNDIEKLKKITPAQWRDDVKQSYCLARVRADEAKLPLFFVGFSLGGLMMSDFLRADQSNPPRVDRVAFFAPALSLRWYSYLLKLISWWPNFVVPSQNLEMFRVHYGSPIGAYNALFSVQDDADRHGFLSAIPTLVFIDPKDAMVSFSGLNSFVENFSLKQWNIVSVSTEGAEIEKTFHHLIVMEKTLAPGEWSRVSGMLLDHFKLQ